MDVFHLLCWILASICLIAAAFGYPRYTRNGGTVPRFAVHLGWLGLFLWLLPSMIRFWNAVV